MKLMPCDKDIGYVRLTWELTCAHYGDLLQETTPEDHLIILCEFLGNNKAHATSSSILVPVSKLIESVSKLLTSECKVTSDYITCKEFVIKSN